MPCGTKRTQRLQLDRQPKPRVRIPDGLLAASEEATPHPRLRLHRGFQSIYLPAERDLVVYLPPGYESEPDRRYPVLYLHDGQNLFEAKPTNTASC